MTAARRAEAHRRLEAAIAAERAAALGRSGERLEAVMREVTDLAARLVRMEPGAARTALGEAYEAARTRALEARRALLIQREAVGARRQAVVDQMFPEPPPLRALGLGRRGRGRGGEAPGGRAHARWRRDTMSAGQTTEAEMMARIESGRPLQAAAEMTADYRDNLVHLMSMQADSELAGGYGYVPWITRAPGVDEKHVVAQIVKDELRHAVVMYGLLADLGVNVAEHVRAHDETFTMRIAADADIGTARITADQRVNIFYYPIETWADFVFFNFCMDRGAGHQLEDVRRCSYGPWARAIEGIFKEEKFHIRHGEVWVARLAGDPRTRAEAQATFEKWYVRTMNIFGRPGSARNQLYRRYRLKRRDNDEVRQAFAAEVAEICSSVGLRVPAWSPVWEHLPEEAQIPG